MILGSVAVATGGCAKRQSLPDFASIQSIHVSLNDPDKLSYWDQEGFVPQEDWPALLQHFSGKPFQESIAKWQALAVIKIETVDAEPIEIEVYATDNSTGCYKLGNYYQIVNEKKFIQEVKRFLEGN